MNGSRRGNALIGASGEDYGLHLKALEIVEVARCRPAAEATELVHDMLRDLARAVPKTVRAKHISGCIAAIDSCPTCNDETRLFRKPNGDLACGACSMDELLAFLHRA
jgi:ribosomal protein S27E